jgi:hypothetical protein
MIPDLVDRFLRRGAADLGLRSGAETLGHLEAHLDDPLRLRRQEHLGVGVRDDELDADQSGDDHVVDGIAAGAADTAYHNVRLEFPELW